MGGCQSRQDVMMYDVELSSEFTMLGLGLELFISVMPSHSLEPGINFVIIRH